MKPTYRVSQNHVLLSAQHPVRVRPVKVRGPVAAHDHDYYEIFMATGGSAEHHTPLFTRRLGRGCVTVLSPGQVHAFDRPGELTGFNLYYLSEWLLHDLEGLWDEDGLIPLFLSASLFPQDPDEIHQTCLNESDLEDCLREVDQLQSETEHPTPSTLFQRASLLKIMVILARAFRRERPLARSSSYRQEVWEYLHAVEAAIRTNVKPDLKRIAGAHSFSRDHFARIFHRETGIAPLEYYQRRRVQVACSRLLNPSNSITDVAYQLGYTDSAHFSRMFRQYIGLPPSRYRDRFGAIGR